MQDNKDVDFVSCSESDIGKEWQVKLMLHNGICYCLYMTKKTSNKGQCSNFFLVISFTPPKYQWS